MGACLQYSTVQCSSVRTTYTQERINSWYMYNVYGGEYAYARAHAHDHMQLFSLPRGVSFFCSSSSESSLLTVVF